MLRSRSIFPLVLVGCVAVLIFGCTPAKEPDSHPEAFKPTSQVAAERIIQRQNSWRDTAVDVAKFERPDLKVVKGQTFSIVVTADDTSETLDLSPTLSELSQDNAKVREILNRAILAKLPAFDQTHLRAIGYQRAKPMLEPYLCNIEELSTLSRSLGPDVRLHSTTVADTLNWLPVVPVKDSDVIIPISPETRAAWKIDSAVIDSDALANIKPRLVPEVITATSFGGMGTAGTIKFVTDTAIIVHPEFLSFVRKNWKIDDDLVLLVGSRRNVRFVPKKSQKLIAQLYPGWLTLVSGDANALVRSPLLLDDKGISVYTVAPVQAPTTKPAATAPTQPAPYFVH